jgi:hypothetical protein
MPAVTDLDFTLDDLGFFHIDGETDGAFSHGTFDAMVKNGLTFVHRLLQ